jgi:hypothetical protein
MGLSGSQARLLSLTARLSDIELQAQRLMSEKISLATQKDDLYRDYCDALDATSIKVAFRDSNAKAVFVDANFKSLCSYDENRIKQYTIKNNQTGKLIVSKEVKENFDLNADDQYAFAHAMTTPETSEKDPQFNYYLNLWTAIKNTDGCEVIQAGCEAGENGTNWFNNMMEAGLISMQVWDDDTAQKEWTDTSVATSTNANYLQELKNDENLKRAEAEYEFALDLLSDKDKKIDTDLSKLETSRQAITQEMDSIKTVIKENSDRTFGLFS